MNRKPIFDAVRRMLDRGFTQAEVATLDQAMDLAAGAAPAARSLGPAGAALIKKWEGCARRQADGSFAAYPDPGSADGNPWTIGWGSTGPDLRKGTIWTQAQCDERFEADIVAYVREVADFLGTAATSQNQFDALVSFHYNTGRIRSATLGKLHRQGLFAAAQAEFGKWIFNDGKPMNGLKSRRADEAQLYGTP
ncbi:lysozyme [Novosphingobium sp. AP12]|uniref:lysozyme n=1 Tax=Novosphingobium sp. AP12 TaxID=1144305 RepID=UPI000271E7A8|nr:lysozyme [Novosphingobium sp. AP12]EJL24521.1 phage-related lysozyme (muraminidase) [Novosphingobium sp. AP12]